MPTILISNDDGVYSPGLLALKQTLGRLGDVHVIAPDRNRSAVSHAKTMHEPVRVHEVELADGSTALACTGGPADCVALGAGGLLGAVPDLVVGGINDGYNMGVDVSYSGTVACAKEAAINGIAGMAVSTDFYAHIHEAGRDVQRVLAAVASVALEVAARLLSGSPESKLPQQTLLNVNVPGIPEQDLRGVHITQLGGRVYREQLVEREDPRGQRYYWIGSRGPAEEADESLAALNGDQRLQPASVGSDANAVVNGFASITPITLDMTDYRFLTRMSEWTLSGAVE